jgi:cytochrome bd-type quinol oxidase subunit 2
MTTAQRFLAMVVLGLIMLVINQGYAWAMAQNPTDDQRRMISLVCGALMILCAGGSTALLIWQLFVSHKEEA